MPAYARLVSGTVVDTALLTRQFKNIRLVSEGLAAPLSEEDWALQTLSRARPVKWHLGHSSWFFENFVLQKTANYQLFDENYARFFDPMLDKGQIGAARLPRTDIIAYRMAIDKAICDVLRGEVAAECAAAIELGLQHEQRLQEWMLADIKHLLAGDPLHQGYRADKGLRSQDEPAPVEWLSFGSGLHSFGYEGTRFAFDNERPRHRAYLRDFKLASRPVSNGEYLAFVEDGGYARPEFWLHEGWKMLRKQEWRTPLYWENHGGKWRIYSLGGLRELALDEPVCHLSYYEADAYARYAQARLPTEYEWEWAAAGIPLEGNFLESDLLHPAPGATDTRGLHQLYGDVWEWTSSSHTPYPGFKAGDDELSRYRDMRAFMSNRFVLRGGSCVTPRAHIRPSYRNFLPPEARWQFSGLRLARDA